MVAPARDGVIETAPLQAVVISPESIASDQWGPKAKGFDEEKAWHSLCGLAQPYFRQRSQKRVKTLPTAQRERLREIAKILRRVRRLVDGTDVRDDLFSAWWEVTRSQHAKPDGT